MNTCAICGNSTGNRVVIAREMMFGFGDEFTYLECGNCGCLQLTSIPADMSRYYPVQYYSMRGRSSLSFVLKCRWLSSSVYGRDPIGWLLNLFFGKHHLHYWMKETGMTSDSSILDVGCGNGNLLAMMKSAGFKHLEGIDPFLRDNTVRNGIVLRKTDLFTIDKKYDCIMFHHSFEHMSRPMELLVRIKTILTLHGRVIVRIPIADSYAYRTYGSFWLQLDAPRHLFLHTRKSMRMLASNAGLRVYSIRCDSNTSQFWGSEQYKRGIFHRSKRSFAVNPFFSIFSPIQLLQFKIKVAILNRRDEGDQACFILGLPD